MNEGIRNVALLVWALCAINNNSYASDKLVIAEEAASSSPTVVYGAAKKSDGGSDEFVVEQPENAPNPLGDPLPDDDEESPETQNDTQDAGTDVNPEETTAEKLPQPVNPNTVQGQQQLGNDFQNTLLEANGMVYDVQAYPEADMKAIGNPSNPATIYSPNVNP